MRMEDCKHQFGGVQTLFKTRFEPLHSEFYEHQQDATHPFQKYKVRHLQELQESSFIIVTRLHFLLWEQVVVNGCSCQLVCYLIHT